MQANYFSLLERHIDEKSMHEERKESIDLPQERKRLLQHTLSAWKL